MLAEAKAGVDGESCFAFVQQVAVEFLRRGIVFHQGDRMFGLSEVRGALSTADVLDTLLSSSLSEWSLARAASNMIVAKYGDGKWRFVEQVYVPFLVSRLLISSITSHDLPASSDLVLQLTGLVEAVFLECGASPPFPSCAALLSALQEHYSSIASQLQICLLHRRLEVSAVPKVAAWTGTQLLSSYQQLLCIAAQISQLLDPQLLQPSVLEILLPVIRQSSLAQEGLQSLVILSCLAREGLGGGAATAASLLCMSEVPLVSVNWRGADLRGAILSRGGLPYADLSRANLRSCTLHGVDLRHACLRDANMEEVDLGVNLHLRSSRDASGSVHVNVLSWLPGSKHKVIGACSDGQIRIWSTDRQDAISMSSSHRCPITSLAVNSDGRWFAAGGSDGIVVLGEILLGRVQPHTCRRLTSSASQVRAVALARIGSQLVAAAVMDCANSQQLVLWLSEGGVWLNSKKLVYHVRDQSDEGWMKVLHISAVGSAFMLLGTWPHGKLGVLRARIGKHATEADWLEPDWLCNPESSADVAPAKDLQQPVPNALTMPAAEANPAAPPELAIWDTVPSTLCGIAVEPAFTFACCSAGMAVVIRQQQEQKEGSAPLLHVWSLCHRASTATATVSTGQISSGDVSALAFAELPLSNGHLQALLAGTGHGVVHILSVSWHEQSPPSLTLQHQVRAQPGTVATMSCAEGLLASAGPSGHIHLTDLTTCIEQELPQKLTSVGNVSDTSSQMLTSVSRFGSDFLIASGMNGLSYISWDVVNPSEALQSDRVKTVIEHCGSSVQGLSVTACFCPEHEDGQVEVAVFNGGMLKYWASLGEARVTTPDAEITQMFFSGSCSHSRVQDAGFLAAARSDGALQLWLRRDSTSTAIAPTELRLKESREALCTDEISASSFIQSLCWHWIDPALVLLFAIAQCTVFQWELKVSILERVVEAELLQSRPVPIGVHCADVRALCTGVSQRANAAGLVASGLLASSAAEIQVWALYKRDVPAGAMLEQLPPCLKKEHGVPGHCFTCLEFAAPGLLVAGGSDGSLSIFSAEDGRELHRLESCHFDSLSWLLTRPRNSSMGHDDCEIFTSSIDGSVAVWELKGLGPPSQTSSFKPIPSHPKSSKKSLELCLRPLWQRGQKDFDLTCSRTDFQRVLGLSWQQRSVLAQHGAINVDLHRSLVLPRTTGQVSGIQVRLESDHSLRIVGFAPAGSIIDFNTEDSGNRINCGDVLKLVNGKSGKDAVALLESLPSLSDVACKELELQVVRPIAIEAETVQFEPPPCCPDMRPLLQELGASLSTRGVEWVRTRARADVVDLFWDSPPVPIGKHQDFHLSERSKRILSTIFKCATLGTPLLIEGDASAGKTVAVEQAAHAMGKPLLKFPVSQSTSVEDILGSASFSEGGGMTFKPGVLPLAMSRGYWLLLDEANLAPESVLHVLEEVFNSQQLEIPGSAVSTDLRLKQRLTERGTLVVQVHPDFCLFATQNPPRAAQYRATRHELGEALLSHFVCVVLEPSSLGEQEAIVTKRMSSSTVERIQSQQESPKFESGAIRLKKAGGGAWLQGWEASWNAHNDAKGFGRTTRKLLCESLPIQGVTLLLGSTSPADPGSRTLAWTLANNDGSESGMTAGFLQLPTVPMKSSSLFVVHVECQETEAFRSGSSLIQRAQHFVTASRVLAGCSAACILIVDDLSNMTDCQAVRASFLRASLPDRDDTLKLPPCVLLFNAENGGSVPLAAPRKHPTQVFRLAHCSGKPLWDNLLRKLAARGEVASSLVLRHGRGSSQDQQLSASNLCDLFTRAEGRLTLRDLLQLTDMVKMSPAVSLDLHVGLKSVLVQGLGEEPELKRQIESALSEKVPRIPKQRMRVKTDSDSGLPPSLAEALECLKWCHHTGRAALVEGPAMCGKRLLVRHWLKSSGTGKEKEMIEAMLHPQMSEQDLFGQMVPNTELDSGSKSQGAPFIWQDGPVRRAAMSGMPLLLKGVHLPSPAVMESLNSVLCAKPGDQIMLGGRPCDIREGFCIVATTTPGAQAKRLSPAFLSRFLRFEITATLAEEDAYSWSTALIPHAHLQDALKQQVAELRLPAQKRQKQQAQGDDDAFKDSPELGIHFGYLSQMLLSWLRLDQWRQDMGKQGFGLCTAKKHEEDFQVSSLKFLADLQTARMKRTLDPAKLDPPVSFSESVLHATGTSFTHEGTTWEQIFLLLGTAMVLRMPVILQGPPSTGKTVGLQMLLKSLRQDASYRSQGRPAKSQAQGLDDPQSLAQDSQRHL